MNALNPDRMTTQELIDEATGILFAGMQRLRSGQTPGKINKFGEISLDFSPTESMHEPEQNRRKGRLLK